MSVSRRIVLHFPKEISGRPIICYLVRDYSLLFNVLRAQVTPQQEGLLVMELIGEPADYDRGIDYLQALGVRIQPLSQDIRRLEERCTSCGACTAVCPTGSLEVHRPSMEVLFDHSRCVACEMCVGACPTKAMVAEY